MKSKHSILPYSLSLLCLVPLHFAFTQNATPPTEAVATNLEKMPTDAAEQFNLSRKYLRGDGVVKNGQKALELMKLSADQGYPDALGGMGFFYATGSMVVKDEVAAVEWFRKGAEKGSAKAQLNLGKVLAEGRGTEKNTTEGLKWIKAAADQSLPEALYIQGGIHYFGNYDQPEDFPAAYPYLLKAAEAGLPDAQNLVGVMNETGRGTPENPAKAEEWFRKAANMGHPKGQFNLGRVLGPENEDATKRIEALAWLQLASRQMDVTATKLLQDVIPGLKSEDLPNANKMALELDKKIKLSKPK